MTIEQMAKRLDLSDSELDDLRAKEQSESLPEGHMHLWVYLGGRIQQEQNMEWLELDYKFSRLQSRAKSFEGTDELQAKLRAFFNTL